VELSRYDWQFSKARVNAAKPRTVVIAVPQVAEPEKTEAVVAPADAKNSAEPAAKPLGSAAPAK
jgi:hypothetical protein